MCYLQLLFPYMKEDTSRIMESIKREEDRRQQLAEDKAARSSSPDGSTTAYESSLESSSVGRLFLLKTTLMRLSHRDNADNSSGGEESDAKSSFKKTFKSFCHPGIPSKVKASKMFRKKSRAAPNVDSSGDESADSETKTPWGRRNFSMVAAKVTNLPSASGKMLRDQVGKPIAKAVRLPSGTGEKIKSHVTKPFAPKPRRAQTSSPTREYT